MELQKDDNHCSYLPENIGSCLSDRCIFTFNFVYFCFYNFLLYLSKYHPYLCFLKIISVLCGQCNTDVLKCAFLRGGWVHSQCLIYGILVQPVPSNSAEVNTKCMPSQGEEFTDRVTHFSFNLNPLFLT